MNWLQIITPKIRENSNREVVMASSPIIEEKTRFLLARCVLQCCRKYMKDPTHKKEFEEWYFRTYGHRWEDREKYRKNTTPSIDNISSNHWLYRSNMVKYKKENNIIWPIKTVVGKQSTGTMSLTARSPFFVFFYYRLKWGERYCKEGILHPFGNTRTVSYIKTYGNTIGSLRRIPQTNRRGKTAFNPNRAA